MALIYTRKKDESAFDLFGETKKREELLERRRRLVPAGLAALLPSTVHEAKGAIITDAEGKTLLDFTGGIGVVNAGHCPPPVVKAIQEQSEKFLHACFGVSAYDLYLDLAEQLAELFPHGDATKVMLTTTGAESVENAIKIARQATGRPAIICYTGAFHGRTYMAASLTSKVSYKTGTGPFAPEVYRIEFPDFAHDGNGLSEDDFAALHLEKLTAFFHTHVPANAVAAIIIECVQGEGGLNVVPKKYLQGLRRLCDEQGILLVTDEVQTGFCRTGHWAAYQHFGITPDLTALAKSMASGMPIGAVVGRQQVMDATQPGTLGGTFSGNPVCCAAALATIRFMQEEDLNAKAKKTGAVIMEHFEAMKEKFPQHISHVRGLGAMMAMEFSHDGNLQQPHGELVKQLIQRCYEKGLLLLPAGMHGNILRILCPLVIEETDLHRGLQLIEDSMEELTAEKS